MQKPGVVCDPLGKPTVTGRYQGRMELHKVAPESSSSSTSILLSPHTLTEEVL